MSGSRDLLIEIGTEELPPKALPVLSAALQAELVARLGDARFAFTASRAYATPRRLAVLVEGLSATQPAQQIERRGPAKAAAFDKDGQPTPAALGFARSCGVEFAALSTLTTDKGEWLIYRALAPGRSLAELLPDFLREALAALPIPKRMRWGSGDAEFVRPVHWLVALHGSEVLPMEVFGIPAGRLTQGHRYLGEQILSIPTPADYAALLETRGKVVADFATRRERVRALVRDAAAAAGGRPLIDEALLSEVTALVEWPSPIVGSFDAHFLEVPREALVASMQGHQKYFPLENADGSLQNRFVTIANIDSPRPEAIRDGNERVIRPRLSDAAFFWRKDRGQPLAARLPRLGDMVFERRLGSLLDKTTRVAALAARLAPSFGAEPSLAHRAGELSRCDLLSEMVGEFPELQGTMGAHYAAHDGEAAAVATALGEFYQPRYAGDAIPASPVGRAVALAEKLDSLVGIFGIGAAPTGDKDPYALRRAALGALRICIEGESALDLAAALDAAAAAYAEKIAAGSAAEVFAFMLERARGYFAERGTRADVVDAVLAVRPVSPLDLARRVAAVESFLALPEAQSLAAANKRISNLLRKSARAEAGAVDPALFVAAAEQRLGAELAMLAQTLDAGEIDTDYGAWLARLAALREPVDAFFDGVLVMADDAALRDNRLRLLAQLQGLFLRVADVGLIGGQQ
ncbi:MAG: glycine--tRNA ligase subunit beta [Gammaproteobacteria bacterium]